jgi:hypothetical protein
LASSKSREFLILGRRRTIDMTRRVKLTLVCNKGRKFLVLSQGRTMKATIGVCGQVIHHLVWAIDLNVGGEMGRTVGLVRVHLRTIKVEETREPERRVSLGSRRMVGRCMGHLHDE